jgi:hypothetical protein
MGCWDTVFCGEGQARPTTATKARGRLRATSDNPKQPSRPAQPIELAQRFRPWAAVHFLSLEKRERVAFRHSAALGMKGDRGRQGRRIQMLGNDEFRTLCLQGADKLPLKRRMFQRKRI